MFFKFQCLVSFIKTSEAEKSTLQSLTGPTVQGVGEPRLTRVAGTVLPSL